MSYSSLDDAKRAHVRWLEGQGLGASTIKDTCQRLASMLIGFEPPGAQVPADADQLYYDSWNDKLYFYSYSKEYGYSSLDSSLSWQLGSEDAATVRGLPLCKFYYDLARVGEETTPIDFIQLVGPHDCYKHITFASVANMRLLISEPKPHEEPAIYMRSYVRSPGGYKLCTVEFPEENWGMEVGLEYKSQKAKFILTDGEITWPGLIL